MGRLPALTAALLGAALLASCEEDKKKGAAALAPTARSEVVQATGPVAAPAPPTAAPIASARAAVVPRKLCDGQLSKTGHDLPRRAPSRAQAPGTKSVSLQIPTGKQWTWVNLWAAWCAPCKEEMPRLRAMGARLAAEGSGMSLAFLSLDDDERQLEQFLAVQPEGGLRATYWLREGRERDEWLAEAGLPADPPLPAHLVVDPRGKIRCVVSGAVEDGDYAEIAAIVSR
jgi:thiol-disulfide isomerase/thioredoxin